MEQEEYTKEEIEWSYIEFIDNQDILDLIEKKPGGIIGLLDEACMFPRSTHETFAEKLYQTFNDHKRFSKPKLSRTDFTIHHYAGDVTYQTDFFLDKNKDYVVGDHQALLGSSRCSFVSSLFPPSPEENSKTSKFSSICTRFKQQLQSLLDTLSATEPHYVRCVKPNNYLKPSIFENQNVLQQLRCGGVMEAIRISCAGFPTRKTFEEFLSRFSIIGPDVLNGSYDEVSACNKLLEKADLKDYQIGKTKVFLRAGHMAQLDAYRNEVLGQSACVIQKKVRSYFACSKFISLRNAAIQVQAFCRGILACRLYESLKREAAALTIQKEGRMFLGKKSYKTLYSSVVCIQTGIRGRTARLALRYRRQTKAAIKIQCHCRRNMVRGYYLRLKWATIVTQCGWRRFVGKRELRNLKSTAIETGALQDARLNLEKQVKELSLQLERKEKQVKEMTLQLEREKRTRVEDNEKLQSALEDMKLRFQESKQLHLKGHDAANRATELNSTVEDPIMVPVNDQESSRDLIGENENLKALVKSLEKKLDDTEMKNIQLKTSMQRLEERLIDVESADQIMQRPLTVNTQAKPSKNSSLIGPQSATPSNRVSTPSIEKQREQTDSLIKCVSQDLGFSKEKPVASCTIYKCLIYWKSFEAEKTNVFDRLIQIIGSAIEDKERNDLMAYWLTNTSALLFLLQHTLRTPEKPPQQKSFFGRMFKPSPSSTNLPIGGFEGVKQVEGKYPALLFKQQITAYVEKLCGIIRDNVKKDLSSLIFSCIQARTGSLPKLLVRPTSSDSPTTIVSPTRHWDIIIKCLDGHLRTLKENYVPEILVQQIFTQVFCYINEQLFNSLLLHKDFCTFSNGQHIKALLDELETWCNQYARSIWEELKHVRQTVDLLVIGNKSAVTYDDLANDLCPILNIQQQYRICTLYWDDENNTSPVNPEVSSHPSNIVST
ncbi:hypothetical protein Leryth_019796 [Lithospermum erythrorhizon]|nr:hypothetical protein Leryth_019796 [Lithospermum erythrorhizon]